MKGSYLILFLILYGLGFSSCTFPGDKREIEWDQISLEKSGASIRVQHRKTVLSSEHRPWYVMVTVNAPTIISFCNQILIHPPEGERSGSKNLFVQATASQCELNISIFGQKDHMVLNPVVYGSMSDLWQYQIKKDGFLILFGFLYLFIGSFSFYVFLLRQTHLQYLAFSLLLFLAGIYSISIGNELFGMLFPSVTSEYWIPILLGSLYLFPGALLWFLSFLLRSVWRKRFRVVGLTYLVFVFVLLLFFLYFDIEFDSIVSPFHLICIAFLFVFFPPLFMAIRQPQYNLRSVLYGIIIFLLFAFMEMGISYFTKNLEFPLLSFGLFCFLLPLGEFSVRRYFRLEAQIQNVKEIQTFRKDRSEDSSKTRISNLDQNVYVQKISEMFENEKVYLDPELSLRKLASLLQIREDQVSYIINHNFKMTFSSLLNQYRINEAKRLLQRKEANILNIAYSVGYQSKSAFNSIFKKLTKMTPTEFQKLHS